MPAAWCSNLPLEQPVGQKETTGTVYRDNPKLASSRIPRHLYSVASNSFVQLLRTHTHTYTHKQHVVPVATRTGHLQPSHPDPRGETCKCRTSTSEELQLHAAFPPAPFKRFQWNCATDCSVFAFSQVCSSGALPRPQKKQTALWLLFPSGPLLRLVVQQRFCSRLQQVRTSLEYPTVSAATLLRRLHSWLAVDKK